MIMDYEGIDLSGPGWTGSGLGLMGLYIPRYDCMHYVG